MRTIDVSEMKVEVRALTGPEIDQLRADGYPFYRTGPDLVAMSRDLPMADKALHAALGVILTAEEMERLEAMPNDQMLKVWHGILNETYSSKREEKNF